MITYFGMSTELGNLSYYDSTGQNEYAFNKPYSEKTSEEFDQEVKKLVETQYARAKKILTENKEGLTKLAELLLEKEVIFSEDLENIFGPSKAVKPEELADTKKKPVDGSKDQDTHAKSIARKKEQTGEEVAPEKESEDRPDKE
jgi:cell division protease FtsH